MRLQDEIKIIIRPDVLRRIGLILKRKIYDRTAAGLDQEGKPFKEYSTRPFAMPAAGIPKRTQKILVKNGNLTYWHSKKEGGQLWVLINGGYALYKKIRFIKSGDNIVNLNMTGAMMRSLRVLRSDNNEITIGFGSTEDANKAYYNMLMGREFLGLLPEDWDDPEIQELIATGIMVQ